MLLKINEDLSGDGDPVLDFPAWAQRRVCSQTGAIRAILDVKQKTTWRNLILDIHLKLFLHSGLVL